MCDHLQSRNTNTNTNTNMHCPKKQDNRESSRGYPDPLMYSTGVTNNCHQFASLLVCLSMRETGIGAGKKRLFCQYLREKYMQLPGVGG